MFFFDLEPNSGSSLAYRRVDVNNDTALSSDYVLSVNNGASAWTINIPSPVGVFEKVYVFKKYDDTSTGVVTIATTGGLLQLNGGGFAASRTMGAGQTVIRYISNGVNWESI